MACLDYRDVTFTDPNGTYTPEEVGFGGTIRHELAYSKVADQTWVALTGTVSATC